MIEMARIHVHTPQHLSTQNVALLISGGATSHEESLPTSVALSPPSGPDPVQMRQSHANQCEKQHNNAQSKPYTSRYDQPLLTTRRLLPALSPPDTSAAPSSQNSRCPRSKTHPRYIYPITETSALNKWKYCVLGDGRAACWISMDARLDSRKAHDRAQGPLCCISRS